MRTKIVRLDLIIQEEETGFMLVCRDRNSGRIHNTLSFPIKGDPELEHQFYTRVGAVVKRDFKPVIAEIKRTRGEA